MLKNEKESVGAKVVEFSDIYGPGIRSVIWVQGCSLACDGCWNRLLASQRW